MKFMFVLLALFSFQHDTRYSVSEYKCNDNVIKVKYEDHWYELVLFNIVLDENSDVCSYIKGDVSFEIDPYIKIENPLNAYVYVNDVMLQQVLIDERKANIKISNPKYKHILKPKSKPVMKTIEESAGKKVLVSKRIAIGMIILWVGIVLWFGYRFYKSRH